MSDFAALNTALSGLLAHRRAAEVIGHNAANVNTEGYSRQRVDLLATGQSVVPAIWSRSDRGGTGVDISGITRARDEFLERRALGEQASSASLSRGVEILRRIEMTFPEPGDLALGQQLADFWSAWDDVGNTPDSIGARSQLLERANTVAQGFNRASAELDGLRRSTVDQMRALVSEINGDAARIADLNVAIQSATAAGLSPNDLLDQRDALLNKITKLAGITVRSGDHGMVSVSLGGTDLVSGEHAQSLEVVESATVIPGTSAWTTVSINWKTHGYPAIVGNGETSAMLDAVNTTLPSYLKDLNGVVSTLVSSVNGIHDDGYALDGTTTGLAFFGYSGLPAGREAAALTLSTDVAGKPQMVAAGDGSGTLDNTIAQRLAALHDSVTGADAQYRAMISKLGIESQTAQRRSAIQNEITAQVDLARKSVSGVNLDEEMVNLTQAQHAYTAAARLMTTIDQMLDTLINGTGVVGR